MQRHQASGRSDLGFALSASTMLLWGMLPLALEAVLQSLDPWTVTGFRFAFAALVLYGFLRLRAALPRLRALGRRRLLLLAVAATFLAVNYLTYLLGLDRTNAPTAQVLIQAAPLLLALGSLFVFGERFQPLQWCGLALLVLGMGGFFTSQLRGLVADLGRYWSGAGLMGIAAVTWAVYGLAQKQLLLWLSSQGVMLCIYVACALLFLPGTSPGSLLDLDAAAWGLLLFASANTLLAYGTFAAALGHWEASRVSAVLALTPLATLLFTLLAAAVWPEQVDARGASATAFAWAAVVVAGSTLVALGGASRSRTG